MELSNSTINELCKLIYTTDLEPSLAAMLLCVSLCSAGSPLAIPKVANTYLNDIKSVQDKIHWIEYTRNGMYKCSILCGIPKVINAQIALYNGLSKEYQSLLKKEPIIPNDSNFQELWDPRGKNVFGKIYGNFREKQGLIENSNPDLWQLITLVYGIVVSDETYLDNKETELEVIVSLIQIDSLPQLHDHILGAKRVGATMKETKAAEHIGYQVKLLLLSK